MSVSTASRAGFPSKSTACTSFVIGASIESFRASSRIERVVSTPSATFSVERRIVSRSSPRPIRKPTVWFRE